MVRLIFGALSLPAPHTKLPAERDKMNFAALTDGRGARSPHTPAYADRHNGQLKNAQPPQLAQAVAERLSKGARDQRARTCRGSMARSRPDYVRQGKPTSSMTINRPAANVDHFAAVSAAEADSRQADYFLRLLAQSCRQIDRRIDVYQRAIAIAETSGAVDHADGIRRVIRIEEQERQTLNGLIDRLQRRFPLLPRGGVLATGSTVGVGRSSEHQAESDAKRGFASAACLGSDACRNGLQGHYLIQPMSN